MSKNVKKTKAESQKGQKKKGDNSTLFTSSPQKNNESPDADEQKDFQVREILLYQADKVEEPGFKWSRPIYLQLHHANIFSVFASGIILPAKYISNRAFKDTQSVSPSLLVFSNGAINDLDESQVLCELDLSALDRKSTTIVGSLCYCNLPIPISRIRKLFVSNGKVKDEILTTALAADGGIIPDRVIETSFPQAISFYRINESPYQPDWDNDLQGKIRSFDKILGAFAYLKNYSILMSDKIDILAALPLHYFYMLNAISSFGDFVNYKNERATQFYRQLFGLQNDIERPFLKWIFSRLNVDRNFTDQDTRDFGIEFLSQQKNKDFHITAKSFLNELADSLKRKNALKDIWREQDQDKFYLYLFGFLRLYGNASTEDKSTARKDIPELIEQGIGEYIFACLGYFYGYKTLRNFEEKFRINDGVFAEYVEGLKPLPLKFDLSSGLDYAIIEAVYVTVFQQTSNVNLTEVSRQYGVKNELIRKPGNLPKDYVFSYEEHFGKFLFTLKKKTAIDELVASMSKVQDQIPVTSEIGIYCLRSGIQKNSISVIDALHPEKWKYLIYFRKDQIIEAVRIGKLNAREVLQRLEISKQHNEF